MILPQVKGELLEVSGPSGTRAILKKLRRDVWVLRKLGVNDHCRFGDSSQITEDVNYFLQSGALPRGKREW